MSDASNASTTESSDVSSVVAALQAEVAQLRLESAATIAERRQTLTTLREENQVLLRRLYGNKTERLHTDETQLAFADLLKDKQPLTRKSTRRETGDTQACSVEARRACRQGSLLSFAQYRSRRELRSV